MRHGVTAAERQAEFWSRLRQNNFLRVMEAHNGLSALVGQLARVERDGATVNFDAFWISSLTDSASRGLPDVEIVGNSERLDTLHEICSVTDKPVIIDGDTGGTPAQLEAFVHQLVRAGASAVVVEDKRVPKRNSLDTSATQLLEDPPVFAQKIARGKAAAKDSGFLVIARLESLIAGSTIEDALGRAQRYIEAGADGILVHSKEKTPDEVFAFAARYDELCRAMGRRPYLVCVPTTYNLITAAEFKQRGFNIVIHANHLLRAAHKAMEEVARSILENDRSFEATARCSSLSDLFGLVGYDALTRKERELAARRQPMVVPMSASAPQSWVPVGDRPLLAHQIDSAKQVGINEALVVTTDAKPSPQRPRLGDGVRFIESAPDPTTRPLAPLLSLDSTGDGFLLVYPDVLASPDALRTLLETPGSIVLAVDRVSASARAHAKGSVEEVVVSSQGGVGRRLRPFSPVTVLKIGRTEADGQDVVEFSGIAHVSRDGAQILRKVFEDSKGRVTGPFHQAASVEAATFTDLVQECIDRGFQVSAVEIPHGWMRVRSAEDAVLASQELTGRTESPRPLPRAAS